MKKLSFPVYTYTYIIILIMQFAALFLPISPLRKIMQIATVILTTYYIICATIFFIMYKEGILFNICLKKEKRSWGFYLVTKEEFLYVEKKLFIKKGKSISYQKHNCREEFWNVASGKGIAIINGEVYNIKSGNNLVIHDGEWHTVIALTPMKIEEHWIAAPVSLTNPVVLSEDDIERSNIENIKYFEDFKEFKNSEKKK